MRQGISCDMLLCLLPQVLGPAECLFLCSCTAYLFTHLGWHQESPNLTNSLYLMQLWLAKLPTGLLVASFQVSDFRPVPDCFEFIAQCWVASRPGDKFSQFFRMPLVRLWTCVVMTWISSPTSDIMLRDNGSPVMGCDIIIGIAEWWSTGSHCLLLLCPLLSPHEQTVHAHIPHHVTCWPCGLYCTLPPYQCMWV